MAEIDHIVIAGRDVAIGVEHVLALSGVSCAAGGQHPGWGTHNWLASLGDAYLEVIGIDPQQETPDRPRPFGIDQLNDNSFSVATFAIRPSPGERSEDLVATIEQAGFSPGPLTPASRLTSDRAMLQWRLTNPSVMHAGGAVPFVIDWGATPNPATTTPAGLVLRKLQIDHPDAKRLGVLFDQLGLPNVSCSSAERPKLSAAIDGPHGSFDL